MTSELTTEVLIHLRSSGPIRAAEIKADFDCLFRLKARERTWPIDAIETELRSLESAGRAERVGAEWQWLPEAPPPAQQSLF